MKYKVTMNYTIVNQLTPMLESCANPVEDKHFHGFWTALSKSAWNVKNAGKKHWKISLTLKQIKVCREQAFRQWDYVSWNDMETIKADYLNRYCSAEEKARGREILKDCYRDRAALKKLMDECDEILQKTPDEA
jgi:hypothetical protein